MDSKNKFGNCADIREDGAIRIPLTLESDELPEGRIFLHLFDFDQDAYNRHADWHWIVKGSYPEQPILENLKLQRQRRRS